MGPRLLELPNRVESGANRAAFNVKALAIGGSVLYLCAFFFTGSLAAATYLAVEIRIGSAYAALVVAGEMLVLATAYLGGTAIARARHMRRHQSHQV